MQRACLLLFASALTIHVAVSQSLPPQVVRGKELFLKSPKGVACATCHVLEGAGTAIGPDIKQIASVVGSHGIVKTIQMQATAYVQQVKTASGESFAGIQKQKQGDELQIWDLSKNPPELRKFASKDVTSMTGDHKWKHPPATAGYTSKEVADLIGYLKFVATGSRKELTVEDVEDAK